MDPLLLSLILCCIGGVLTQWGVVLRSGRLGLVGSAVLVLAGVVILLSANGGN